MHTVITDGDVDPAVNGHAHTVSGVVCTTALVVCFAADVRNEDFRWAVGLAVFILILKNP